MFEHLSSCTETVSLWYALLFDAGTACVSITPWSVLQVVIPFAIAAFVLQAVVNRLMFGRRKTKEEEAEEFRPKSGQRISRRIARPLKETFKDGPIL